MKHTFLVSDNLVASVTNFMEGELDAAKSHALVVLELSDDFWISDNEHNFIQLVISYPEANTV
jgi:hypothetical protein